MVSKACELIGRSAEDTNVISCHLGAGCSVTATKGKLSSKSSLQTNVIWGDVVGLLRYHL